MATQVTTTRTCDKSFCEDHLLLSPKDVGLWDLMMLLFSKNIGNREFIDCPNGTTEESFSRRFVIFISIVAQKVLQLVYKPLSWVGSTIEFMPNFMHANGGFFKLLLNTLSGEMVLPNKESPEYLTAIGLLDIRRDLDNRIKYEDPRWSFWSSSTVITVKLLLETKEDYEEDTTTQGFMWSGKKGDFELIGVCFRGTSPFNAKDWSSDLDLSWYKLPRIGKVHAGFLKALGLQKSKGWPSDIQSDHPNSYAYYVIRQKLKQRFQNNPYAKFFVTGHSLGAALSVIFPAILAYHNETDLLLRLEGVYTFGQPRVGDHKFGDYMKEVLASHGTRYHRFVYCNDLVPRVPYDSSNRYFKHFGDCHYYNSFYKGQVVPEEPNKNYFSILAIIPMFANAFWELVRSFIMYYQNGPEYCETYTCRSWRVVGLLIAGLSAHGPTDYVNLTRLGSPELFLTSSVHPSTNNVN
ncbi:hypothetical protein QVD17_09976 [Tagetes erecta]|uniref:Fungal lipase-type domain-containing protein n=1 Tax=Tagetes erecta TaxID=13708 RepID=A0AAD8L098_TARER|nr:hypothetical protein QVD17_09976 [Tagetes erecta]